MRITVVVHSVCGNSYLIARGFADVFSAAGHDVLLRRVTDTDWVEKPELSQQARELLGKMRSLSEAVPEDLAGADLILMGCPVYFGNVTAEMKALMDATGGLWFQGKLTGRRFAAFVSAGNAEGGGDLALQALHTYARYMGMTSFSLPVNILPGENTNALGLIQYSGGKVAEKLDDRTSRVIERWAAHLTK